MCPFAHQQTEGILLLLPIPIKGILFWWREVWNILLAQSPPPRKIIFIDQNERKLRLKREIADNVLLQHLHVHTVGVSAARNSLDISQDVDWILFCDDDGYLMEGYTKKFLEVAECLPWVKVIAGSIIRDDNGEFYTPRHGLGGDINKFSCTKLLMGSNFACKAEIFKKLGGFDERFGVGSYWGSGEETDFAWKAHFSKVPMALLFRFESVSHKTLCFDVCR